MKDSIYLLIMLSLIVGIVMGGIWYVNEQYDQYAYEQQQVIDERRGTNTTDLPTTQTNTDTDPFGLFGANEVVYEVTFATDWSDFTHPDYYPSNAHLSPPVIWVGRDNPVFAIGQSASEGIEVMAEEGRTRSIKQELEKLMEENRISDFQIYSRVDAPGQETYEITISRDNPVVSLVSMIAPSPDWFVAIEGVNLLEDNRWRKEVEIATIALDAGTEEGDDFTITNPATDPRGVIGPLTDIPSQSLRPFAFVQFKLQNYAVNQDQDTGE